MNGVFTIFKRFLTVGFVVCSLAASTYCPVFASERSAAQTTTVPYEFKVAQLDRDGQLVEAYRLHKYDVLNIVVVGFSQSLGLRTTITTAINTKSTMNDSLDSIMIGPDGYANLPYAGTVKLSGLTIPEATDLLTEKLGEYIKIPSMSIMIKEYGPRQIHVMGSVKNPGVFELKIDSMNVFAALSNAGGITKKGRPKHIAIVRVVDGKVMMKEINFDRYIKNQDIQQNIALEDGDMVYVPESNKIDLIDDIMPIVGAVGLFKNLTD